MGRKKKETLELETQSMAEDAADASEASDSEWEAEEAEALAAEGDEPAAEAKEEATEVEAKEEKPKRKRRARKAKAEAKAEETTDEAPEETTEATAEAAPAEKAEETPEVEVQEVIEKSKRSARAKRNPEERDIQQDVAVASVTVQKSMDAMVKQWAAVKDISSGVTQNFDRMYQQLNELQSSYAETVDKLFKQSPPKPTPITKVAMATSAFAIVLSILSFTFAQSVRSSALILEAQRKAQSTMAVAAHRPETAPAQPEIAYGGDATTPKPFIAPPSKPKRAMIQKKK